MVQTLNYFPGQQAVVWLETFDGYGGREDSPTLPLVTRVILPGFTLAVGYPQPMTRLDVGLYYANFTIPTGGISVGNYLVDTLYTSPVDGYARNEIFQIIVQAPFGNFSTTVVG